MLYVCSVDRSFYPAARSGSGWCSTQVGEYAPEARPASRQHQLQPPTQAAPASTAPTAPAGSIHKPTCRVLPFFVHRQTRGNLFIFERFGRGTIQSFTDSSRCRTHAQTHHTRSHAKNI
jgi:hypothetical protein